MAEAASRKSGLPRNGTALAVDQEGVQREYGTSEKPATPWVTSMLEGLNGST